MACSVFSQFTIRLATTENSTLACRIAESPSPLRWLTASEAAAAFVEEESARCGRLREITQQRQALAARTQAGFAACLGSDTVDTVDLVAQRRSLAQLDSALRAEAEELAKVMHMCRGPGTL